MFIHSIFQSPRPKKPNPRGRRPRAGCCLELESLETRTPLASGLAAAVEAPVIFQAVELGRFGPERPPGVELASLAAGGQPSFSALIAASLADLPAAPPPPSTDLAAPFLAGPLGPLPGFGALDLLDATSSPSSGAVAIAIPGLAEAPKEEPIVGGNFDQTSSELFGSAIPFKDLTTVTAAGDHYEDDGVDPPFNDPLIFGPMGPAPWHLSSQLSSDDENTDMGFAGTLENIETQGGSSPWSTTPLSNGRAAGRPWSSVVMELWTQVDLSSEVPGTSGLSYLATAEWSNVESAPPASAVDDALAWEESSAEPVLPTSIIAGGVSLEVLLGGPEVPVQNDPGGVEQVALLVPLPETSLALAATVWTASSDSTVSAAQSSPSSTAPIDRGARSDLSPAWAVFVTGTDQALEQICRDIRESIDAGGGRQTEGDRPLPGLDRQLEWQGPILPVARARDRVTESAATRSGRISALDEARKVTTQALEVSENHSDQGPRVVLGSMPMLSVVSISTVIAGWFWKKRRPGRNKTGARPPRSA